MDQIKSAIPASSDMDGGFPAYRKNTGFSFFSTLIEC